MNVIRGVSTTTKERDMLNIKSLYNQNLDIHIFFDFIIK